MIPLAASAKGTGQALEPNWAEALLGSSNAASVHRDAVLWMHPGEEFAALVASKRTSGAHSPRPPCAAPRRDSTKGVKPF